MSRDHPEPCSLVYRCRHDEVDSCYLCFRAFSAHLLVLYLKCDFSLEEAAAPGKQFEKSFSFSGSEEKRNDVSV